jgi:hypothetical protein
MAEQQAESQERAPDRPDMRDPTNGAPLLQGKSSTTGLGGEGGETAGGGVGPDLAEGTAPEAVTARSPGMSNAGAARGAPDGATRTRGAGPHSVGGTGAAGPGSDATDDGDDGTAVGRER